MWIKPLQLIFYTYKFIRELLPMKCCSCKKKFYAKEMWCWDGWMGYVCDDCFNQTKRIKEQLKHTRTKINKLKEG